VRTTIRRSTLLALTILCLAILPLGVRSAWADDESDSLSDAQILGVLQTVDWGEITEQSAIDRADSSDVQDFAEEMVRDHGKGLRALHAVSKSDGPAENSQLSRMMARQGRRSMNSLDQTSDNDFDQAYIKDQVRTHNAVLHMIDDQLLPEAQSAAVINLLQAHRKDVAEHLRKARALQRDLGF
jgi:putative membrane protein